jgi:uncharacterized protein YciI
VTACCTGSVEEKSSDGVPDSAAVPAEEVDVAGYDPELARRLGADEYGMKTYVLAMLKAGPNRDMTEAEAMELQTAHMKNIQRLADEGKLVVAGPFLDGGDFRGLYIFDVESLEEARALTETDPAIQRGSLEMELHTWYGSAAMNEINSIHSRLMAKSATD